ncbi:MAG: thiol:disulfide interchange protein [Saprospiraceae bacterium]|jgi:thiol:disulfide interchange protein
MKKLLFFIILSFSVLVNAQDLPYNWSYNVSQEGETVSLEFTCDIDSGWHIYPTIVQGDLGLPTTIIIAPQPGLTVNGTVVEPEPHVMFDSLFEVDIKYHEGKVVFSQSLSNTYSKEVIATVSVQTQACKDGGCLAPETEVFEITIPLGNTSSGGSIWIFIAGLGAGLLALLTPCVFPMIPMTVTFFTKQAQKKSSGVFKAFVYGVSIVVIYVSLGLGITLIFGEEVLNKMASSPVFNIAFFVLLVVFAISFLGFFEITIPSAFVNKIDSKADKGGWIGIFFMAFALALISFSCTGPLIGTLLVQAAVSGGGLGPFLGMLGFGIGIAFPFTLFAIFPNWLNKLPKSGGWLNSVKVVLGLLELALALKFLSNADLVYQAHIITRELFIVLWIVIAVVLALYLFGKIRFAHDSKLLKLSIPRRLFGLFFIALTIYMLPGLWGAPLKLLSGVLPPTFYRTEWIKSLLDGENNSNVERDTCPNGLQCYHDYDEALKIAKAESKPLFVDFTGWTCVNCRYMEQNVWSDPKIDSLIRNEFVLVSLYVDSRKKLPDAEKFTSPRNGKEINTYGGKWAELEITKYGEITQPLYVLLGHDEQILTQKQSYTTDAEKYRSFLQKGIDEFKRR